MTKIPSVKFNKKKREQMEFYKVLRKRVNQHFTDNNITKNANANMVFKTIFMLSVYLIPLFLMLTGVVTSSSGVLLMWIIMGFGMSGIGLAVMHDANHGSYSSSTAINKAVGYVINLVGGFHTNWKIQHNVLHHSYTNIDGFDEDIDKGVIRFSPNQERKPIFKYQILYAPFLYGILSIYWLLIKDFEQLIRYNRKNLLKDQGMTFGKMLVYILFNKAWYIVLTVALPLMLINLPTWEILGGFFLMHFISGLVLALIFQSAHVLEETHFFKPNENGGVDNNWAIHQMMTTANFANSNRMFSWLIGGLNFQIEHHLFPHICHVHYHDLSKIVKQTAEEFDVPYNSHVTFLGALKSHFTLLHELGTGEYDRKAALASSKNMMHSHS